MLNNSGSKLNTSSNSDYSLDKDAISLLKNQLSQIKQIKLNNERKDKMIKELHQHIEELMRFKDEAFHLNNEVRVLKDKLREVESESRSSSTELIGTVRRLQSSEVSLKDQLRTKNDELIAVKQEYTKKMELLNTKMSDLVSEYEQLVFEKQQLEKAHRELEDSSRLQLDSIQRTQEAARSMVDELNETTQKFTSEKSDLTNRIHDLEQSLRQVKRSNDDQQDTINHLNGEIHKLERNKLEQAARISDLEQKLHSRDETIQSLNETANRVPDLKQEAEKIPFLRGEIEELRAELSEVHQELKKVRAQRDLFEDKNDSLNKNYEDLQGHAEDMKKLNQQLKEQLELLRDVDSQRDFLHKQSEHLKQSNNNLKDEISSLRISESSKHSQLIKGIENLKIDLSNMHKMIDNVISGVHVDESLFNTPISQDYFSLEGLRSTFTGARNQVIDCLHLVSDLRDRIKLHEVEIDRLTSIIRGKDEEIANTYQSLLKSNDENEENRRIMKRLSDECDELQAKLSDYQQKYDQSIKEAEKRRNFIIELFIDLQRAADKDFDPRNEATSVSWENFKIMLTEFASVIVNKKESLQKDIVSLESHLNETEDQLSITKGQLADAWETTANEKVRIEELHNIEIEDLRKNFESQKQTLVNDFTSKREELEELLENLNVKHTALELQLKKSNLVNDMLQNDITQVTDDRNKLHRCLILLARGIRPLKNRIDSLTWQKKFLQSYNKQLEESRSKILSVVEEMNSEFRIYDESLKPFAKPKKTTARVAALAVIAHNRLNRLLKARKEDGALTVKHASSSEVIQLLDADEISTRLDLPQCTSEDRAAENFMQLCSILDPKLEHYEYHDDSFLRKLKNGFELKRVTDSRNKEIYEISLIDNVKDTSDSAITTLRKINGQRNKLARDSENLEKELIREQQRCHDLEENIRKKQELIDALDLRIQGLERENLDLISPQKYNALQSELDRILQEKKTFEHQRDQFKEELEEQIRKMSSYRTEGQNLTDSVRDYHFKLEQIRRDLKTKNDENQLLQGKIKKLNEELVEINQEKKKFQYMVTELSTQNMLRSGTFSSPSKTKDSPSSPNAQDLSRFSALDDEETYNRSSFIRSPTRRSQPLSQRNEINNSRVSFADDSFRSNASPSRAFSPSRPNQNQSSLGQNSFRQDRSPQRLRSPNRLTSPSRKLSSTTNINPNNASALNSSINKSSSGFGNTSLSSSYSNNNQSFARDSITLNPLIQDLSNSQQIVHALSEANARAEREMRELDVELQKARESLTSLRGDSNTSRYRNYNSPLKR